MAEPIASVRSSDGGSLSIVRRDQYARLTGLDLLKSPNIEISKLRKAFLS